MVRYAIQHKQSKMDVENKRYLDIVYKNCKNDTQLFLTTIVNYLPAEFLESNAEHDVLQVFAAAAKDRQSQLAKSNTVQPPDVHDNTSCDMFDDDDEIVPETQEVPTQIETQIESEDSGESVCIPFYDKKNTCNSENSSKRTNDSNDESEYMQVHPESNVIEPVADEPQSQFIMANIDQNLIRDLGMSQRMNDDHASSDSDESTLTEADLAKENTRTNENPEKPCDDRSGSTTPDLDFLIDPGQGNSKEADQTNDENGENQQHSESIFENCTQQFCNNQSTDDMFAMPTQPLAVFKHPASSTPIAKTKSKPKPVDESIFEAETQLQEEEDIFEIATQMMPSQKPPSAGKSTVDQDDSHAARQDEQEEHDKSDDLFEKETQPVVASKQVQPSVAHDSPGGSGSETDVYDEATQIIAEAAPAPVKRISMVATQSQCEPANTPPWSMAARLPNEAIEQYEKQKQAEQAAKERIRKRRYLFATSDEDDDSESDLEFDLAKPAERISSHLPAIKENASDDSIDENHLKGGGSAKKQSGQKQPPTKKQKANDENIDVVQQQQQPGKRQTRQLSVKVSREEVEQHLRNRDEVVKPKESAKATVAKTAKSAAQKNDSSPKEDAADVRKSKRTRKPVTKESPPAPATRGKKPQKPDENVRADTPKQTRNTRGAKKGMADDDDERTNEKQSPIIGTMNQHYSDDIIEIHSKRRHSDRHSTRKLHSNRLCILFTKVNPAPYTKIIDNLGGSVVDTPQLGGVLICDKISRTFKFLYCLAKGLPIVTPNWLTKSAERGYFQPTDSYLISDIAAEKRFNFSLKKSLETARRSRLFTNYHIYATPNVQPTTDEICEIVECSGGKYGDVASMKRKPSTKVVLITHKKDKKLWPNYRRIHPDLQIVSSEGFMQSVVQQEINFQQFELTG